MRRGLILFALIASACSQPSTPITKAQADALADQMLREYLQDVSAPRAGFAAAKVVQVEGDGWSYRWFCRDNPKSAVGVFVQFDGKADYDEAPACVSKF